MITKGITQCFLTLKIHTLTKCKYLKKKHFSGEQLKLKCWFLLSVWEAAQPFHTEGIRSLSACRLTVNNVFLQQLKKHQYTGFVHRGRGKPFRCHWSPRKQQNVLFHIWLCSWSWDKNTHRCMQEMLPRDPAQNSSPLGQKTDCAETWRPSTLCCGQHKLKMLCCVKELNGECLLLYKKEFDFLSCLGGFL